MRFVVDASVAVSWCMQDEASAIADRAFDLSRIATALVPAHWWFETRNALLVAVRRKRLELPRLESFLRQLNLVAIEIAPIPDDRSLIMLAQRHRLTFYDAAYLELAQRERIELATLDAALIRAAASEGVALVGA
ncbi:type II toxin-antitoxin system VapC family toxin [Rhodopseudomonas sp. AAP120]|uniref:type II toxin-antitoxin system VapC family toxin n=1 Tax=Rhodopseudomonas sp. AAP120 TaxID=1523430 RepID=UPI001FD9AAEC|nr:type II toxin-antitoxin system VapC family toxin [Rhodopseudomonas sp. AAP120]